MYISYSGWKKFDDTTSGGCNFAYWNSYINNTPIEGPDDRLGSIFGSVVGKLFEDFYNFRLWKLDQPQGKMVERIDSAVAEIVKNETTATKWRKAGVLMWKGEEEDQNPKGMYANIEELKADVRDAIDRGFRIIRDARLLGPKADAEVKLDCTIDGYRIGGRCDFIIQRTRPYKDLGIIDGKGSKWGAKYVDDRQLIWYDMLFRRKFGVAPDFLAWVFWRFEPPEGFVRMEASKEKTEELLEKVLADLGRIEELSKGLAAPTTDFEAARKVFLPVMDRDKSEQPKDAEQACRFCPYGIEEICPSGAAVRQAKGWG